MDFLKWLWRKWKPIAQAIGNFQAQLILTVFYLIITLPIGIVYRFFVDPLRMNSRQAQRRKSNFQKWEHPQESLEEARKQY